MTMTAKEILETVTAQAEDTQAAIYALEDGEYLAEIGCTDDDQEAVEEAYAILKEKLDGPQQ